MPSKNKDDRHRVQPRQEWTGRCGVKDCGGKVVFDVDRLGRSIQICERCGETPVLRWEPCDDDPKDTHRKPIDKTRKKK